MSDEVVATLDTPQARLGRMAGDWEGVYRLWFQPDMLASEDRQWGTLRPVLGGRFLLHEYHWTFDDRTHHGMALIGFHVDEGRWECAWIDSFHCGSSIMFSQSPGREGPGHVHVLGSYGDGQQPPGPRWGWRTEIEQPAEDALRIVMTNIAPDGTEAVAVEVDYLRVP